MNFYKGNGALCSVEKKYGITRLVSISSIDSLFDYGGIIPRSFDLMVEGNGPQVVYVIGLYDVLKKLQKTGDITISHYRGSGLASIVLVCLCSNMKKQQIINFFKNMFQDITNEYWKKELLRILPSDAYRTCSNRVFISTLNGFFSKPKVFSTFQSNRDIVDACSISFLKPCSSTTHGCFFTTTPQLKIWVSRLYRLDCIMYYQKKYLYQLYKERINSLVTQAKQDADLFFTQRILPNTTILEWCEPSYSRRNIFYYFLPSLLLLFFLLKK